MKVKTWDIMVIENNKVFLPIPFIGTYKQVKTYAKQITCVYQSFEITCKENNVITTISSKLITK